jgi:hypothetical protein
MALSLGGAELAKKVVLGGGVSAGAIATYELFEIAKKDPHLLQAVIGWGPLFIIAVVAIVVVDRNFGQMIQLGRDNVQAQQRMSEAMEKIADKDDRQAQKLETLSSYSALQSEKVLNHLDAQGRRLDQHGYLLAQISEVLRGRTGAVIGMPPDDGGGDKARSATA